MEAQLVTLGLRHEERLTSAEVLKAYKKKILLHASGKGGGKIESYTNAYVQVLTRPALNKVKPKDWYFVFD